MDGYHAKLSRPDLARIYPRARLFEHLDTLFEKPVIWISAPPGAGKTTLAASYQALRAYPTLWYRVDSSDADIASFFYYLALCGNQSIKQTLPLLTSEYVPNVMTFAHRFFEQFFSLLQPNTTLIFDNYQELPEDSPLHSILYQVLEAAPPNMHIIFLSRGEPPVPIAALKAKRRLAILEMTELQFTPEETAGFAAQLGHVLPASCIETIHEKTHGWTAGVILMLESIREGIATAGAVTFARQNDDLFAYFSTELLARCDAPMRDFLLRTSLFPRMTADMAGRLTACNAAGRLLARLHRSGWFTEKHSGQAEFFSYHPLFRDFLLNEATNSLPADEYTDLKRTAAKLLQEAGEIEEAALLYCSVGDWQSLVPLVISQAPSLIDQGRSQTLERLIGAIPLEIVESTPWPLFWLGACRLPMFPLQSLGYFDRAFELFRCRQDLAGTLLSWSGSVDAILYQWDDFKRLDERIEWLEAWLKQGVPFPTHEAEARVLTSMCGALMTRQPQHRSLEIWFEKAWQSSQACADVSLQMRSGLYAVNTYAWRGDRLKSEEMLARIEKLASLAHASPAVILAAKWLAAGTDLWFGGLPESALQTVHEGLALARATGVHVWDDTLYCLGVFGAIIKNDMATAEKYLIAFKQALDERRLHGSCQYHYLAAWSALVRSEASLSVAHAERALDLAEKTGYIFPEILCHLELAYVLCGTVDSQRVRRHLTDARKLTEEVGSVFLDYMCLLAEAHVAFQEGFEEEGLSCLNRAMSLGKQQGYYMLMYWWVPTVMASLCTKALENRIETEYVQAIIRKHGLVPPGSKTTSEYWPWPLKIYTLGRFGLIKDGVPVRFTGKVQQKPLEMLKALIALGGRDVAEEKLCDALWPDADGDAAHKVFSVNLLRLRRLIGHDNALLFQDGRLSLNSRCCWVDSVAFERLTAEAEALWKSGQVTQSSRGSARGDSVERESRAVRLTEKAIALYSGHFFSAETGLSWGISTRERLRSKFIRLVETLGCYWEETGQLDKAIDCHQKGLETDDLIEEFYQHLMVCHHALGQQAKGVELYRRCRLRLAAELGLKPSSKTEAIYKTLLN